MRGWGATTWWCCCAWAALSGAGALDNGLGATPALGWSSWNFFTYDINETIALQIGAALVSTGLRDAGFRYLNIDAGSLQRTRGPGGKIAPDPSKFPRGFRYLSDRLHDMGLRFGVCELCPLLPSAALCLLAPPTLRLCPLTIGWCPGRHRPLGRLVRHGPRLEGSLRRGRRDLRPRLAGRLPQGALSPLSTHPPTLTAGRFGGRLTTAGRGMGEPWR